MDQVTSASEASREIEQKQRQERETLRRDAELLEALLTHPGWPRYKALIEAVAQNFYAAVMKPMENSLEVTRTEFAKGTLNGLTLASSLPGMKIKEAQEMRRPDDDDN